jgi:hypothetical protein
MISLAAALLTGAACSRLDPLRAVGRDRFVDIARAYMFPIQTQIGAQPTPDGRREVFQRLVVDRAKACHRLMDQWGAPPMRAAASG